LSNVPSRALIDRASDDGWLSTRGLGFAPTTFPQGVAQPFSPLSQVRLPRANQKGCAIRLLRYAMALRVRADRLPSPVPPSRPQSREPDSKKDYSHGDHRHLYTERERHPLRRNHTSRPSSFRHPRPMTMLPTSGFSSAKSNSGQGGRRPRRTAAILSVSGWMTRGAPIFANLVEAEDSSYILIWSRRSAD
jgi:hypothetical protein